ncbi:MAG: ATP cone domain-containing protein, partial [Opitutaceae bacterium]|nr:ATP cone domain-containing protein [Opitutaceae bacterium]
MVKRDGRVLAFDERKIALALARAGEATGAFGAEVAERLAADVTARVLARVNPGETVGIEQIQDEAEAA